MIGPAASGQYPEVAHRWGPGPFIYAQWQPNDHFTATRNPNYWRTGYPYLDQITFKPIPDTPSGSHPPDRRGGPDRVTSDPMTIKDFPIGSLAATSWSTPSPGSSASPPWPSSC